MKELFAKNAGRVAVAVIAILLIVLVAFLAIRGQKAPEETSPVVDNGPIIIESQEVPAVEVPETEAPAGSESEQEVESEETTSETVDENEEGESSQEADITENQKVESTPKPAKATAVPQNTATTEPSATNKPEKTEEPEDEDETEAPAVSPEPTEVPTASPEPTVAPTEAPIATVTPEPTEADEYYQENGTIIRVVDASESEDVPTEEEVISLLSERGFDQFPITYEFVMGGEYEGMTEITGDAEMKRPMYVTYYRNENNELWTICVINGEIFAIPVSYNAESTLSAQLLISESEELTSYHNDTNKYYITIPKESAAIVKVVDRIDADTLNQLTCEEIDNL